MFLTVTLSIVLIALSLLVLPRIVFGPSLTSPVFKKIAKKDGPSLDDSEFEELEKFRNWSIRSNYVGAFSFIVGALTFRYFTTGTLGGSKISALPVIPLLGGTVLFVQSSLDRLRIRSITKQGSVTFDTPAGARTRRIGNVDYTWTPSEPEETRLIDTPQTKFTPAHLQDLVSYYSCEVGPWHPDFGFILSGVRGDPRDLRTYMPGQWSEKLWRDLVQYILDNVPDSPEDREKAGEELEYDQYLEYDVTGAIFIATGMFVPNISTIVFERCEVDEKFLKFIDAGYKSFTSFRGELGIQQLADYLAEKMPESEE